MILMAFLLGGLIGSAVMYYAMRRDLSDQTETYQSGLDEIAKAIEAVPTLPKLCPHCGQDYMRRPGGAAPDGRGGK